MAGDEELLRKLEERFILGEITEDTYKGLRAKLSGRIGGAGAIGTLGGADIRDSVIKGDVSNTAGAASVGSVHINIADLTSPRSVTPELVLCPICGRRNPTADTFQCRQCGRDHLCVRHLQFTVCETCSAANEQEQARILREQQQRDAEQKAEQEAERRAEQERIRQQQAAQKAKEDAERQAKQEQASHQRAEQARQQAEAKQRRMAEIYHEQAQPRWFAKSHGLKAGYVGDWVLAYGDAPSEDLGLLHGPCVYCVNARKRFSFCIELNEKALFACDQVLKWALVDTKLGIYAKAEPDWPRRERDAVSKLMNGRLDWLANNTQLKRTQSLSIRGLVWILEIVSDDIVLKSIASVEMKTGLLKKETVSENVITVGGKTASVRGKTFGRFGKIFESELPAHFNI